jgi:thioredoxin 1
MKVEMFYVPGCGACVAQHDELCAAARKILPDLEWREINVLDNLDHAVERGVLTLPSLVIDGEVVFTSMPTVAQLRKALAKRSRVRA